MKYGLSLPLLLLALLPAAHAQIGFNSPAGVTPRQDFEVYTRNGLLIQQKYTLTTADPNASINTLSCAGSPPTLTAQAGILKDPGGDSNYPASLTCSQQVSNAGVSGFEIVFEDFDTEAGADLLTITDINGAALTFSGATLPETFLVAGSSFTVRFQANGNTTVGRGFRLRWRAVTVVPGALPTPGDPFQFNAFRFDARRGSLLSGYLLTGADQRAGNYSTALGLANTASGYSSVALGYFNSATGDYSTATGQNTIASGYASTAVGYRSTTSGYASTAMGETNTASGDYSTAMGSRNAASGAYSTAMGGLNTASGAISTAMGGFNTASGDYSTAMGYKVSIPSTAPGAFAIGDADPTGQGTTINDIPNLFVARFRAGYYLMTSGNTTRTGVQIAAGQNSWSVISDSTRKERLLPMNHAEVLRKINAMKLSSWNYKGQPEIRHYGPMAQDFYAAFGHDGLGQIGCDTLIYSHDFAGVTFAGVQALVRENEALKVRLADNEAHIRQNETQMQQANARIEALEALFIPRRRGRQVARK